jgi:hypothetical protein
MLRASYRVEHSLNPPATSASLAIRPEREHEANGCGRLAVHLAAIQALAARVRITLNTDILIDNIGGARSIVRAAKSLTQLELRSTSVPSCLGPGEASGRPDLLRLKFSHGSDVFCVGQSRDESVTSLQALAIAGEKRVLGRGFHRCRGPRQRHSECHTRLRSPMTLTVECEQEFEGRWLAEVPQLHGIRAYGATRAAATEQALLLAYRLLEDESRLGMKRLEPDELYGRQSERVVAASPVS